MVGTEEKSKVRTIVTHTSLIFLRLVAVNVSDLYVYACLICAHSVDVAYISSLLHSHLVVVFLSLSLIGPFSGYFFHSTILQKHIWRIWLRLFREKRLGLAISADPAKIRFHVSIPCLFQSIVDYCKENITSWL